MSGERDREQAKQWDDIIVSIAQFADDRITIGCLRRDLKKFAEAYAASLRERNAQLERRDLTNSALLEDYRSEYVHRIDELERECEGLREALLNAHHVIKQACTFAAPQWRRNALIGINQRESCLRGAQKGAIHPKKED